MTTQVLSRSEDWFKKHAWALVELLWGATLVATFVFAAILALTLVIGLAADVNLIKIPARICSPDSPAGQGSRICN
ncbi:hypothetical protein [Methylocystis bryophila]|uniref:Uncharacterized protein n=1 Tax=Methylocystis bryophila TaxID=655015 RepID=A0A1W6MW05_9HYPH|nr:hypothetical protein [Methylocystis bryophila]ARN81747.1 hypothetical protein B1812_12400 [Methylocystis bryophila]BDV37801.1 hypothetical protein DSM21852_10540 [Methylocystis bryophila]